ncbi:MAG: 4'-phosphopantetheinyl transferase superfamily protein [Marinilabiliaceae bacterium]|nr:4'-phosphopantetheinyl transferase superfamily protein [Marinilabiliaceae bacterium]
MIDHSHKSFFYIKNKTLNYFPVKKNVDRPGIDVFWGNSNNHLNTEDAQLLLSKQETLRLSQIKHNIDKTTYIISHSLLRKELSKKTTTSTENIEIDYKKFEKPNLINRIVDFNLSHSSNYFSFALTQTNKFIVGVDIEVIKPINNIRSIVNKYFNVEEINYISDNNQTKEKELQKFYEIWTRKEAFYKMLGLGIGIDLTLSNMTPGKKKFQQLNSQKTKYQYFQITTILTNQFALSISTNNNTPINFIEIL